MVSRFSDRSKRLAEASESELVQRILFNNARLYDFFGFVVEPAIEPDSPHEWDYQIFCNVERRYLGLDPNGKPGDVDVLIVPLRRGLPEIRNSIAVEVKRVYLPTTRRSRDANTSGVAQAQGLLEDGFPIVGVLHFIIAEPSLEAEMVEGRVAKVLDSLGRIEFLPGTVMVDPILSNAPFRQLRRLETRTTDVRIGLNSVCISTSSDGRQIRAISTSQRRDAVRNLACSPKLLRRIEWLYSNFPASLR